MKVMKARIGPIVKQIWLVSFVHYLYYFVILKLQQFTTWADTSLVSSSPSNKELHGST